MLNTFTLAFVITKHVDSHRCVYTWSAAGSMQRYGDCLVCSILRRSRSVRRVCCCGPCGQAISVDCCTARLQQALRSISAAARRSAADADSVMFRATSEAEHRLDFSITLVVDMQYFAIYLCKVQ